MGRETLVEAGANDLADSGTKQVRGVALGWMGGAEGGVGEASPG